MAPDPEKLFGVGKAVSGPSSEADNEPGTFVEIDKVAEKLYG
jgi:hypothetical protein